MEIVKEKTIAFTGDSVLTTPTGAPDHNLENVVRTELYYVLEECCNEGKDTFLCGMDPGFDLLAAEVVSELKKSYSDIKLYAIIPFTGQEDEYDSEEKILCRRIDEATDGKRVIWSEYCGVLSSLKRNDFMIENSSEIIAYRNNNAPGAYYTVYKARKKNMDVLNLYDELLEYFTIDCEAKRFLQDYTKIPGMSYGREGVIFRGDRQPFPVGFEQINHIENRRGRLVFTLKNDTVIEKSQISDDCWVRSLDGEPLFCAPKWLTAIKKIFRNRFRG